MSEDPFAAGMKGLADFWASAGKATQQMQQEMAKSWADPGKGWGVPKLEAGKVPQFDTAELARANEGLAQLWKTAGELSGNLARSVMLGGNAPGEGGRLEPTAAATLQAALDPRSWMLGMGGMDSVLGAMAQGPQLADLWQSERQQAHLLRSWGEMRRRLLEHNTVVMQGWMQATKAFGEEVAGRSKADGRALDHKAALALWIEIANRELLTMQRSDAFLQSQAAVIRSGADFRMAQRQMAEKWAEQFDLPSRTELDDVHRTLTELRREFRAYKRKHPKPAATATTEATAAPATPATPSARKKS